MKEEYQIKKCSQSFYYKLDLRFSLYREYPLSYPALSRLRPTISLAAYDLFIAMCHYQRRYYYDDFRVAENYWRKTCCFTQRAFLKARAELIRHQLVCKHNPSRYTPPTYSGLRGEIGEDELSLSIPSPVELYLSELLKAKLINRATRYLYFYLFTEAQTADFPESIFLHSADIRQSLGHPSPTLLRLIAKLKALGLVEVNAAKTCHSPSEFFILVPQVEYPMRKKFAWGLEQGGSLTIKSQSL